MSGARRVKGRHARPASAAPAVRAATAEPPVRAATGTATRAAVRRARTALAEVAWSSPRRPKVIAGGAVLATAVTGAVAAVIIRGPATPAAVPKATAANVLAGRPVPAPAAAQQPRSSRSARRGDQTALAYYARRDPAHAAHVIEVIWTGPMLRVYTDLPASQADSKTAIALCETAAAYAQDHDRLPSVFVHAGKEAGYPVLANKMNTHDDCRLGRVP